MSVLCSLDEEILRVSRRYVFEAASSSSYLVVMAIGRVHCTKCTLVSAMQLCYATA